MKLENKVILITGAARGIGRALALQLKENNKLILISKNPESLKKLENEITSSNCVFKTCDVKNLKEVEDTFKFGLEKFGKIDLAILNAGLGLRLNPLNYDFGKNKEVFDTNFYGVLNYLKYLIPYYVEKKEGTIVGISSLADVRGFPYSAAYSASKAALSTYLEGLRNELKSHNIKVINVRPGFIDTDMITNNEFKMYFILKPEKAAKIIIRGIEKTKSVIQFPKSLYVLTSIARLFPNWFFDLLMRTQTKS